jgi:putative hydrolase of the HAD superfamily
MTKHHIRNIVFDIGNVVVRWSPEAVCEAAYGKDAATPEIVDAVFGDPLWPALNRGEVSVSDAMAQYALKLGWSDDFRDGFFGHLTESLIEVPGTIAMMDGLQADGYQLYALTDNVHEIMAYLRARYDFWAKFTGVVNSAELGTIKPDPAIYHHLLNTYDLVPEETLFLDDLAKNVAGAQAVGIHAIQFATCDQAKVEMRAMGVRVW